LTNHVYFYLYMYTFKKKEQKLGNEKCASNRETHIYTMICCLLVDLSALFVHINIYTRVQRTRQHGVQIDEKNIETTRTLSLSLSLLLDSLPGFSHPSILRLALAIRSHYFYYNDDYYHRHAYTTLCDHYHQQ
jgi:hypothetical protein